MMFQNQNYIKKPKSTFMYIINENHPGDTYLHSEKMHPRFGFQLVIFKLLHIIFRRFQKCILRRFFRALCERYILHIYLIF